MFNLLASIMTNTRPMLSMELCSFSAVLVILELIYTIYTTNSTEGQTIIDETLFIVTTQQQPQPNNKTTKTVVGLRVSNCWEPPPTTGTQNCMIEQK